MASGANCPAPSRGSRNQKMAFRGAIFKCPQLLYAVAWPRGYAIGNLCRMAPAWNSRRADIAGLFFIMPGAVIMVLAAIYALYGQVPLFAVFFYGVKAAVLVIVMQALLRIARKALAHPLHWFIAACAFIGIFSLALPFPIIVLAAGLFGFLVMTPAAAPPAAQTAHLSLAKTGKTVLVWLCIWLAPLAALMVMGVPEILMRSGDFFRACSCDLWRGLCGSGLYGARCGGTVWLAGG